MIERQVDEIFEFEGIELKVLEDKNGYSNCLNCFFNCETCDTYLEKIGECAIAFRKDKKSVSFVKSSDENE